MLTKDDLQAIGQIIDQKFDQRLLPIEKDIRTLKKDVRKIRSDLEMVTGEFDERNLTLERRVDRIEKHLDLPPIC